MSRRWTAPRAQLEGRHDFAAFQTTGGDPACDRANHHPIARHQDDTPAPVAVARGGELILCEITGDGFLRHMVRAIVGTLVEIGRGKRWPPDWMRDVLASRERARAGPTAPACGLCSSSEHDEYGGLIMFTKDVA